MHVLFSNDYFAAIPMDVPFAMQSNCRILDLVLTKRIQDLEKEKEGL
jgi:hypothetical protein